MPFLCEAILIYLVVGHILRQCDIAKLSKKSCSEAEIRYFNSNLCLSLKPFETLI